jgi:uncharacterized protein YfaS (alpha-2-macroglobulin family)
MGESQKKWLLAGIVLGLVSAVVIFGKPTFELVSSWLRTQDPLAPEQNSQEEQPEAEVLGNSSRGAQIYIYGSDNQYSSGGLVSLASTDDPAITIGGYNLPQEVTLSLYEAPLESVFTYLKHDKEGKQTQNKIDVSGYTPIAEFTQSITNSTDEKKVSLPLAETGVYYLKVLAGKSTINAYIIRSSIATVVQEGDNELVFWAQDLQTKRSLNQGSIKLFNLEDGQAELGRADLSAQGIATLPSNTQADVGLLESNGQVAIVPINLEYLNYGYSYKRFLPKNRVNRYFVFTDRPLYRPGDVIFFKAIVRDEDDARYQIPSGELRVQLFNDNNYYRENAKPLIEKRVAISAQGGVDGQFNLPKDAKTGYYYLKISSLNSDSNASSSYNWEAYNSGSMWVQVEHFKKPEYFLEIDSAITEMISGDAASVTVRGTYFSGQPLINQNIKYTVRSSNFFEYQYLRDWEQWGSTIFEESRYGGWYGNANTVAQGSISLDKSGSAQVELPTTGLGSDGEAKVFTIEATLDDESQTPARALRSVLVHAGEWSLFRDGYSAGNLVNQPYSLPLVLEPMVKGATITKQQLTIKPKVTTWEKKIVPEEKYPRYEKHEETLPDQVITTDAQGRATYTFVPSKVGTYTLLIEGKDARGNLITKTFSVYISDRNYPALWHGQTQSITVSVDKLEYEPEDIARLTIYSDIPDRDVFLSIARGRLDRYQVVSLQGNSGVVEVPLQKSDLPNTFAHVSSFSDSWIDSASQEILLSQSLNKLKVELTPDKKLYGPGETVDLEISTTNGRGQPQKAEVAIFAVDKAIFELSDSTLGNIFEKFWSKRYFSTSWSHSLEGIRVNQAEQGGGCFVGGTLVTLADGTTKPIENIQPGDRVLSSFDDKLGLSDQAVVGVHKTQADGYLLFNGSLKITPNHRVFSNEAWIEAGSVQIGDWLLAANNERVVVESIAWQKDAVTVYNLEVENTHTYFAGGVWVHNQKGESRSTFKDTAYWNPSVQTDESGRATIRFKLPDNLTTWTIAGVAATADTAVGQTTSEVLVSKAMVVRPIVPNILRLDDEVFISALVQNFTDSEHTLDVSLSFDTGTVETPQTRITLDSKEMERLAWKVKPTKEAEAGKFVFSAKSTTDKKVVDSVHQTIPVKAFGFQQKNSETGNGNTSFEVKLPALIDPKKSSITLSLSPTLLASLPSAMEYLIGYPYGCVEQTTSRFVPLVIAQANPTLFAQSLKDKDTQAMLQKGLSRLAQLQQADGGWPWYFSGKSNPFVTVYVAEYLVAAQKAGISVDSQMLEQTRSYFQYLSTTTPQEYVVESYARVRLGLLDEKYPVTKFEDLENDYLALAVMANIGFGDTNSNTNGLQELKARAEAQGDGVFWKAGSSETFGSIDASTALAIRALVAGNERPLAAKGVQFLLRNRKNDYWSNTFATAQIMQAATDFAQTGDELSPDFTYQVMLDDKPIKSGSIASAKQSEIITMPLTDVQAQGSEIKVSYNGNGQLYSTLSQTMFITDKEAKAIDQGLAIKRAYVNEKGAQYSPSVGDTIQVNLTVSGLEADERYAVIADELPAGLVPINEMFKNESTAPTSNSSGRSYGITDREVTENGMILSLSSIQAGEHTYSYRARVVSAGTFAVPPAQAQLMYAPEVYGQTAAESVTITEESYILPQPFGSNLADQAASAFDAWRQKPLTASTIVAGVVISLALATLVIYREKHHLQSIAQKLRPKNVSSDESDPPTQAPSP